MAVLIERLSRKALRLGTRLPGGLPTARRVRANELAVAMYHGIAAESLPFPNWCHLPLAEFRSQIQYLADHYTVLPLSEAIDRLEQGRPLPKFPAVITFDDAFRSVFTEAAPVLAEYGLPATVYVVTGLADSQQPPWTDVLYHALEQTTVPEVTFAGQTWDVRTNAGKFAAHEGWRSHLKTVPNAQREAGVAELCASLGVTTPVPRDSVLATMGWQEIEAMAASGLFEFGSHTHTHPILARCTPAEQEAELRRSRDILRDRLGYCDTIAYPNGGRSDFDAVTLRLASELGYRAAMTTISGLNRVVGDLAMTRRVNVANDTDLAEFQRLMVGC